MENKPIICECYGGLKYWACPCCKHQVGGYTFSGTGENDWGAHQDKFCPECGSKIDWDNVNWYAINRI